MEQLEHEIEVLKTENEQLRNRCADLERENAALRSLPGGASSKGIVFAVVFSVMLVIPFAISQTHVMKPGAFGNNAAGVVDPWKSSAAAVAYTPYGSAKSSNMFSVPALKSAPAMLGLPSSKPAALPANLRRDPSGYASISDVNAEELGSLFAGSTETPTFFFWVPELIPMSAGENVDMFEPLRSNPNAQVALIFSPSLNPKASSAKPSQRAPTFKPSAPVVATSPVTITRAPVPSADLEVPAFSSAEDAHLPGSPVYAQYDHTPANTFEEFQRVHEQPPQHHDSAAAGRFAVLTFPASHFLRMLQGPLLARV
jgi:hypothetical protein